MWFRDYFRNRKKLMDENATLRRQLFYAEKSCDEMAEMLQAVGTERLTPLIHDSCRGCSYAVWRLADLRYMQHAFFLGCRKQNSCESFVPETKIIWAPERTEFVLKAPQKQSES